MILHPLHTDILPPEEMNNPFDYEPHPLCLLAAEELQRHISQQSPEWLEEVNRGKMFGVLVAQPLPMGREANQLDSSATKTNPQSGNTPLPLGGVGDGLLFLAAYSGQICGRSDWDYFVPAVFDYLQPDGYFKTHEAEITQINHEIAVVSTNEERQRLRKQYHDKQLEAEQAIKKYSLFMTGAKMLRDQQRKNSFLSENDKEQLIRESQFQKAQLKRIKKQYAEELQAIERQLAVYNNHLNTLEHQRKEKSRALQQWLFDNFKLLNHNGETRSLQELFADTVFGEPPSGAGECCEPKLLHYAYTHNLRPLCMAMFWWGDSPKSEVRHHLHYYPACSGKCKPILSWMMAQPQQKGKEAHPQTFPKGRESNCSTSTVSKTNPRSGNTPSPLGGVGGGLGAFPILYEDPSLIIVSKPAGLLTIPGVTTHLSVYSLLRDIQAIEAPSWAVEGGSGAFIVHRLDQDTSGLLVVAKTREVERQLQRQFAEHTVVKRYRAILDGILSEDTPRDGEINLPLRPNLYDRPRQIVDYEQGKPSLTRYHVDREEDRHTWITLSPLTGRTHQLRMHCAHRDGLNCPILGDPLYGRRSDRLYLHAYYLEFTHPVTGERIHFEDKAPF